MVGVNGVVYGIERDEALIRDVYERIGGRPPIIEVMRGDASSLPLSEKSVDYALLKGVLHEVRMWPWL